MDEGTPETALLAIDWGTTTARAYAVDAAGNIRDTRSGALGVQQVSGDFPAALDALLGDWRTLAVPRIAAGMIGSRQGWVEAKYVECPADFEALGNDLATTPGGELAIVPGLLYRDSSGVPDVMRGEETQLAGAVHPGEESVLAVLPGTHSKWARVEHGRLMAFQTHMTGELYSVLLAHSILGRLAAPAGAGHANGAAFTRGVERGLSAGALSHLVFGARSLALTGALEADEVRDWLSGLLIGYEIRHAAAWAAGSGPAISHVRVIGADVLVDRYADALQAAGIVAERGPADAAVRGLHRIARLARLVA